MSPPRDSKTFVSADLPQQCQLHAKMLKDIADKVDEIHGRLFVGNGAPSWSVRLDRLEVERENAKTHRGILYTSIIGLAVTVIGKWLLGVLARHPLPTP